jgi:hypothetical protein
MLTFFIAFVEDGVPMPTYQEAMAQHEATLAALRGNHGVVRRSETPAPSAPPTTTSTPAPTSTTLPPATAHGAVTLPSAQPSPSTPTPARSLLDVHDVAMSTPLPARVVSMPPSTPASCSTPQADTTPLSMGEPGHVTIDPSTLPPPYSLCQTPKQGDLVTPRKKLNVLRPKARHLTIDTTLSSPSAPTPPRTPHTPKVSSPLARGPSYQYSGAVGEDDEALPTPHDRRKAYKYGHPRDIFGAIPRNSGVLASEGDVFSSDDIAVEASTQRVGVRLSSVYNTHLSGESLSMNGGSSIASASGPSARVLRIDTKGGLAASAYLNRGKAHLTVANLPALSPVQADAEPPLSKRTWTSRGSPKAHIPVAAVAPAARSPAPRSRRVGAPKPPSPSPSVPPPSKRTKVSSRLVISDDEEDESEDPLPSRRPSSSTTRGASARSAAKDRAQVEKKQSVVSASSRSRANTLDPVASNMLHTLGITVGSLSNTALANPASLIIEHAPELGATFVCVLDHLVTLDVDDTVCLAPSKGATHYSTRNTHRPEAIALYINRARKFNKGVFKNFNSKDFADDFWAWWNELAAGVCFPHRSSKFAWPGALRPGADFDPMLWRGPNGFGTVVVGLAIWIFGLKLRDPSATKLVFDKTPPPAELKRWMEAVKSVEVVAAAMVDSLA